MIKNREEYGSCLIKADNIPVFHQKWWLDVVCNNSWNCCISRDKEGKIKGLLPYYKVKKIGMSAIVSPKFTPYLGPLLFYPANLIKPDAIISFEKEVISELIKKLPKSVYFSQFCLPEFTNWMPFYWNQFRQTTFYTYQLTNIKSHSLLYENLKGSVRTEIKKSADVLEINIAQNATNFIKLAQQSLAFGGLDGYLDDRFFSKLDKAILENGKRIILEATYQNQPLAAIYILIDTDKAYLMGIGLDRSLPDHGAVKRLIWEGIKESSRYVDTFDFEGSMNPNFERVFRSFGANPKPYFHLFKWKNLFIEMAFRIWKRK